VVSATVVVCAQAIGAERHKLSAVKTARDAWLRRTGLFIFTG
jgi:hypothetical protein